MSPLRLFGYLLGGSALLALVGGAVLYLAVQKDLPSLEQLENPKQELSTRILSSEGEILDNFFVKRRTYVPYKDIAPDFFNALVATEDKDFNEHWGVHVERIIKAAVKKILGGRTEGASTITQQLARNLYFTQEQTLTRKIKEAITAMQMEQTYTKQEILELYANTVYFGRGAYGIEVAALMNFGKTPKELTTAESAYLIALLKSPSGYDARDNPEDALRRRNLVLTLTYENGLLDDNKYLAARQEPIKLAQIKSQAESIAPHFVEMIRQKMTKDLKLRGYDMFRDGLVIYTTLNAQIQRYANQAVAEHLRDFQKQFGKAWSWQGKGKLLDSLVRQAIRRNPEYVNADTDAKKAIAQRLARNPKFIDSIKAAVITVQNGTVIMDAMTGAILAMVGASPESMKNNPSAKYSLNHVTQIRRQPGSSFKPFVYASALEQGVTPYSMVDAGPFSYTMGDGQVWSPQSSDAFNGPVPLTTALKYSINTVSARLITSSTSPSLVIQLARRLGITTEIPTVPAIALGAAEVIPLEITAAYAAFANQGIYVEPVYITRIEDRLGNVLFENKLPKKISDALSPKYAQYMTMMMQGVVDGGTASKVRQFFKHDAAGKTGTTNNFADAWFIGYTPQLVGGVWVGFDDQRIKFTGWYGQGGNAAAPIWGRAMAKIYNDPRLPYKQTSFGRATMRRDSNVTEPAAPAGGYMENVPGAQAQQAPPAEVPPAQKQEREKEKDRPRTFNELMKKNQEQR